MNPLATWLEELIEIFRLEREQGKLGPRGLRAAPAKGLRPKVMKHGAKPRFKACKWC